MNVHLYCTYPYTITKNLFSTSRKPPRHKLTSTLHIGTSHCPLPFELPIPLSPEPLAPYKASTRGKLPLSDRRQEPLRGPSVPINSPPRPGKLQTPARSSRCTARSLQLANLQIPQTRFLRSEKDVLGRAVQGALHRNPRSNLE